MASTTERTKRFLAENPRMMGVLFTAALLLSQAGMVLAEDGTIGMGP